MNLKDRPEYHAWWSMLDRCGHTGNRHKYAKRNIKVCDEWLNDFWAFYNHIGPKPSPDHVLDRKDNNGHYEPGNVRWATAKESANNRSTNKIYEYNGERLTIAQWAEKLNMPHGRLRERLKRGWSFEEAIRPW